MPVALAVGAVAVAAGPRASARGAAEAALARAPLGPLADLAGRTERQLASDVERDGRALALERAVARMPDLTQTDPELGAPGGGNSYCGPVAVSNALMWWAERGFAGLLSDEGSERAQQIALVRRLGSSRYMGTSANSGTGAAGLMVGLERFVRDRGYRVSALRYQGWRGHPRRFSTGISTPRLEFITSALDAGQSVFINVGWYQPSTRGPYFRRRGGHWLTAVGHGVDAAGNAAPGVLVVHDPAPWAGNVPARHVAKMAPLADGFLLTEDGAFPSTGHHHLLGEVLVKHAGDLAVIDGVVALALSGDARVAGR